MRGFKFRSLVTSFAGTFRDARYALRSLRRSPAFTATAVLTIALGVGGATAIFSIVDGVLLKPLPYAQPDRLVRLYEVNPSAGGERNGVSLPDLEDWRTRSKSFAAAAGYAELTQVLTGRGEPRELRATFITGDFFGVLGTPMLLGRSLDADDERQASRNVVISSKLWRSEFGAAPTVLGQTLALNGGEPFTIVGVAAPNFRFPSVGVALWAPQSVLGGRVMGPRTRENRSFDAIARLSRGETIERTTAKVNAIAATLSTEYAASNEHWSAAAVVPLKTTIVGNIERPLTLVLALVGSILLIACANVAHLLLARGAARAHEVATRMALGADGLRIARQSLAESAVLALLGGAFGVGIALVAVKLVLALYADSLPRAADIGVDLRTLGFASATSLAAVALFGWLPASRMARSDPRRHLRTTRGEAGGRRTRQALVAAEVALATVLVVGAGLMAKSFLTLRGVDPGFDADHVLTVTMQMNVVGRAGPPEDRGAFLRERRREITERVRELPGVTQTAMTNRLPLRDAPSISQFRKVDANGAADDEPLRVDTRTVSPEYFRAMGIPLLAGTTLGEDAHLTFGETRDSFDGPRPVVVSESAARAFWPGEDAVGKTIAGGFFQAVVVGVVGDVRAARLAESPAPMFYMPEVLGIVATLVVRTSGDPALMAGAVRGAIREIDPQQSIRGMTTLHDVTAASIANDRFFALLYTTFGSLALALAAVGVYGVVAYAVGLRWQEIGVRIAVGARDVDIARSVIGGGMRPVLTGVAMGAALALPLAQLIARQLYGVGANDLATFVTAPLVLIGAALLACYLPARRAARTDPIAALRAD